MNAFHDGDVFPVDVSPPIFYSSIPQTKSIQYTIFLLSNPEFNTSDHLTYLSQYDPQSLSYMLDFFRHVAQSIPSHTPSPTEEDAMEQAVSNQARDMLQDRAGIIVLQENLDYYVIPPRKDIQHPEMLEVKRAAGRALLKQDGIFSGLRKSEEAGSTEQHLIEMLTAG